MSQRHRSFLVSVDFREGEVCAVEVENAVAATRPVGPVVNENAGLGNEVDAAKAALGSVMPEPDEYTPDEPFGKGPSDHPADDELDEDAAQEKREQAQLDTVNAVVEPLARLLHACDLDEITAGEWMHEVWKAARIRASEF